MAGGSASISGGAGTLTITQSSDRAIINWQGFSIDAGELTNFIQPGARSATLNRVTGGDPSAIYGTLQANGQIYLVNPNGILVGPSGVINAQSFIASTLDVADSEFMAGGVMRFSGSSQAKVENLGTINALGGDVFLIGKEVVNAGTINAPSGTVGLAGGTDVILTPAGAAGSKLAVAVSSGSGSVTNSGTINAVNVELKAAGGNPYALAINNTGVIKATGVSKQGGRVFLHANTGTVRNTGTITATGSSARIEMKGSRVENSGRVTATASGGDAEVIISGTEAVVNTGTIEATATGGLGHISLNSDGLVELGGTLFASGDKSQILVKGSTVELIGKVAARATGQGDRAKIQVTAGRYGFQYAGSAIEADGAIGGEVTLEAEVTPDRWKNDESYARHGWFLSGSLSAQGQAGVGGTIRVLGDKVDLYAATLDASGSGGGGEILVGGNFQGLGAEQRSRSTTVNAYSKLRADATVSGAGGRVIVWSDGTTLFSGSVTGRGLFGDGGFAEISGKETLSYGGGSVDMGSLGGGAGTVLFDPKNIIVSETAAGDYGEFVDPHKATGNLFGQQVIVLNSGNVLITAPSDDYGPENRDTGAVYLFHGITHALISSLKGSTHNDQVGSGGITVLSNGNYVVSSPTWDRYEAPNAGAVTWGSGLSGVNGYVSLSNSMVGTFANDQIGSGGIEELSNGNFVVLSPLRDRPDAADAGAVTWVNGAAGLAGEINLTNSLVGVRAGDQIGSGGIFELANGHYLVKSPFYDREGATNVGALTWVNATTGLSGVLSTSNSMIGTFANDQIGSGGIEELSNGNFVVLSPLRDRLDTPDAGAVTWVNGAAGLTGELTTANSLMGARAGDQIGSGGIFELANGHYLVKSPFYDREGATNVGAITWVNATTGLVGEVNTSTSLVGRLSGDQIGSGGIFQLANGNLVISSPSWDKVDAANAGAVTWMNGASGRTGEVDVTNSMIGTFANDQIGSGGVVALGNGNFVVVSPLRDRWETADAGAVTWVNGAVGLSGEITISNSMLGTNPGDRIGSGGITQLTNGNFIISSPNRMREGVSNAGAVTWVNAATGMVGELTYQNSLVGTSIGDVVGSGGIVELSNGNYLVFSPQWDKWDAYNAGAVTWGSGTAGVSGIVGGYNSIVGGSSNALTTQYQIDSVNSRIIFAMPSDSAGGGGGRVVTISLAQGGRSLTEIAGVGDGVFATSAGAGVTITPSSITDILNTGTQVILQANNDITLASDVIANNAGGAGGNFTLQAGRSILIKADINTDNGNLTMIGNDTVASGVINAYRDTGAAVISADVGTQIQAGTGTVTIELRNGAGKTYTTSGDITLAATTAHNLSITNNGPTAGSDILQHSGTGLTVTGTLTLSAPQGSVTLQDANNSIANLGNASSGSALRVNDSGDGLNLTGAVQGGGGNIQIATTGDLTMDALASIINTGTGNVYLAAQLGNFINNSALGAGVIGLDTGRWLIYTQDAGTMVRGGLLESGIQSGSYSADPPEDWNGTPGNRVIDEP